MVLILFKFDGGINIYLVVSINIVICSIVIFGDIFLYIFYMNLDIYYCFRRCFLNKFEFILYKEFFLYIFVFWCNEFVGNFYLFFKLVFRKCGFLIV